MPATVWYRSGIDLAAPGGRWRLTLLADAQSARRLTQRLFGLDPDEDPEPADLADALKELVNIAAGVFKRDRSDPRLHIALPEFDEGGPASAPAVPGAGSVRLTTDPGDLQVRVLLAWRCAPGTGDARHEP
ncbi:MAG: chemotaxis protein CheX [bacterium]|nr:chemotaxis protein CheX [bacterium]